MNYFINFKTFISNNLISRVPMAIMLQISGSVKKVMKTTI